MANSKNKNHQDNMHNSASIKSAFSSISKGDSVNKRSPSPNSHSKVILQKCISKINSVDYEHFSGGEAADGIGQSLSFVINLNYMIRLICKI